MRNTEQQYRDEWATLTGRPSSQIYVPEAIRDTPGPLVVGSKIRILEQGLSAARVEVDDVLEVLGVEDGIFRTNAPRLSIAADWAFYLSDEGTGWERVTE